MASQPIDDTGPLLTFRIADARFAMPARSVREVVRRPRVTRVPHAPESLVGLANLRGAVLPLVSLGSLVGKPVTSGGRVIVLDQADPIGILVDEVFALVGRDGEGDAALADMPALLGTIFDATKAVERAPRPGPVTATAETATADDFAILLAFAVSGQEYALPLEQIEAVTALPADITLLPGTDAVVVGTIARRNRLLPLLSLQALLGLDAAASDRPPRVVIARIGSERVGLVVDAVRTIVRVAAADIDPVPAILSRGTAEARIQAICRLDGGTRLISILAADHLVRAGLSGERAQPVAHEGEALTGDAVDSEQFLVFRLGEQTFGLPIAVVSEVTMPPERLTRLPSAPPFVEGVMNLRGQVVPVIDQRRRFLGDPASGKRRRVIIVTIGEIRVGFVVDTVCEVLHVATAALRAAPELGDARTRVFDRVAGMKDDRMILIVEPRELVGGTERDLLAAMACDDGATS